MTVPEWEAVAGTRSSSGGDVGRPRADGLGKVTGAARYTCDLLPLGALRMVLVRSTRAHAEVVRIDTSGAEAIPNVVAVLTARDARSSVTRRIGHAVRDRPLLAEGKVRYYGEPVAAVVARTATAAEVAAEALRVTYRDLPAVDTASEALRDGAPQIHEERYDSALDRNVRSYEADGPGDDADPAGNLLYALERSWGDVDGARSRAACIVRTASSHPPLFPFAMEPYATIADWDGRTLSVTTANQHPYLLQVELAELFGLPRSAVRVSVPYVGGAFGAKAYTLLEPLVALAAVMTRRPVSLVLDTEGSIYTGRTPHAECSMVTGFDLDGRIVFRDAEVLLDAGAYAGNIPLVLTKTVNRAVGPYRIDHVRIRGRAVYTNRVPAISYRGFGATYGNVAGEAAVEQAADELGLDAVEVRAANLPARGEPILPGRRGMDADLATNLRRLSTALPEVHSDGSTLRGVGLALSASDAGALPSSSASVRLLADGSALVMVGATELGQGSHTVLARLAAERLGLAPEVVRVVPIDTDAGSWERTTGASRTTTLTGRAVQAACDDAVEQVCTIAAKQARVDRAAVRWVGGGVDIAGRAVDLLELYRAWFGVDVAEVRGEGLVRPAGEFEQTPPFWEIGMVGVSVSISRATGVITLDHLVTLGSVGHPVDLDLVKGQELGSATQGLGGALFEELVFGSGQVVNSNLVDYRVPRAADRPATWVSLIDASHDGVGPHGAKGVGEGALNPIASAVVIAVARATGRWCLDLPLRGDKVLALIHHDLPGTDDTSEYTDPEEGTLDG